MFKSLLILAEFMKKMKMKGIKAYVFIPEETGEDWNDQLDWNRYKEQE